MRDYVVIYPTQKKADDAFRRTVNVFRVDRIANRDPIRRKITLCNDDTIRFLSENNLCHKLASLVHDNIGIIDCWRWDDKLDEFEKEVKTDAT